MAQCAEARQIGHAKVLGIRIVLWHAVADPPVWHLIAAFSPNAVVLELTHDATEHLGRMLTHADGQE